MPLNIQSCFFSLLFPHFRRKIRSRIYDFIFSLVDEKSFHFHLSSELSHHNSRFRFVLISLHYSFILIRMIICSLISLCKCMVILLTCPIISETSNIWLLFSLLFDLYLHDFDLITIII